MIRNTIIQSVSLPVGMRKTLAREAKKRRVTISAIVVESFTLWMEKQSEVEK